MKEALVVGAGIAGLSAAVALAKAGYQVEVWEEHEKIGYPQHCTGLVSHEGIRWLEEEFEIKARVERWYRTASVYFKNRKACLLHSQDGFALIDRVALEREMWKRAEKEGVYFKLGKKASAQVLKTSRYQKIIGADGPFSIVAKTFGFPALTKWVHTSRFFLPCTVEEVEIYLDDTFFPGFFAWRVGNELGAGSTAFATHHRTLAYFGLKNAKALPSRPIPIAPRKLTGKTAANREIYLVGDAAGQVKPLTGGGIVLATRCATLLAHHSPKQYDAMWKARYIPDIFLQELTRKTLPFAARGIVHLSPNINLRLVKPTLLDPDLPIFHIQKQILKTFTHVIRLVIP